MSSTATHRAPVRRRVPKKTIVGVTAVALALVAGTAYALYVLTMHVTGTVSTKTASASWTATTSSVVTAGSTGTCQITAPSSDTLNLTVSGYPGDTCEFKPGLAVSGASEDFRVTGFTITGLPSGWSATDPGVCGMTLGKSGDSSWPDFTITVGPSGSGTISGSASISPVSQVGTGALTCPAVA